MNALQDTHKTLFCKLEVKLETQEDEPQKIKPGQSCIIKSLYKTTTTQGQVKVGTFSGYASVFDEIDSYNDRVVRGAFKDSLNAHQEQGRMPKMLWQHSMPDVIGTWHQIYEDDRGLYVAGQLLLDVQKGREAYSLMQAKAIDGLSIGFHIREALKGDAKNVRLLTKLDLVEVSLVTLPANSKANVTAFS